MKKKTDAKSLKRRLRNLSSIIKINEIINSTLNLKKLLITIMEICKEVMNVEASSLMLRNEKTGELTYEVALGEKGKEVKKFRLKKGQGIAGWVAEKEKPLLIPEVEKDPRFNNRLDRSTGFKTKSVLAVPMKVKGKIIGVLEAINPHQAFGEEDVELFTTFANQSGVAIENARLYQSLLEQQKVEEELRIARLIQNNLLPQKYPRVKGIQFWAKNIPVAGISGDFYDFIELGKEQIGIVLGDICGKGIPAALFMAKTIGDFKVAASLHKKAGKIMNAVNNLLTENISLGLFITSIYMVIDRKRGTLTYVNAGHPAPLIKRLGKVKLLEGEKGLPLGISPDFSFEENKIGLRKGDLFFLYTDGLSEAKARNGRRFSAEKILKLVKEAPHDAAGLGKEVLQKIKLFSQGKAASDDRTVVTIMVEKLA